MPTVMITGANRGLGLEFARQYARDGWRVIAACRKPAQAESLRALGATVELHELDVTDFAAVHALARKLDGEAIDVFIANAGVLLAEGMTADAVDEEAWALSFRVNTMAPIVCAGAFVGHVARSQQRKLLAMSSRIGAVSVNRTGGQYVYRSSKAALNAAWRAFALDHPEVIATLLAPGRVRTDMTHYDAPMAPEESVTGMRRVVAGLTQEDSGEFFVYDGQPAPW